jgi:hypothetical protein
MKLEKILKAYPKKNIKCATEYMVSNNLESSSF